MSTNAEQVKVQVHLEEKPAKEIPMTAYAFDAHGILVASAPVDKEGQIALTIPSASLPQSRLFIASTPPKERKERAVTIDELNSRAAFEVTGPLSAGVSKPITAVIPAHLIKIWPWCLCRVRGKVVRPIDVYGATQNLPVCHARVHICRLEPFIIRVPLWPDSIIKRLRDEVLAVIEGRFHPPLPDPPPELILETSPEKIAQFQPERRFVASKLARANVKALVVAKSLAPSPAAPAPSPMLSLPAESRVALQSPSANVVRDVLIQHAKLLRPYFCYWPWLWPWLFCEEVAVVDTTEQGLFDTNIVYLCFDRPDLYFWVEYFLNGVWTTVYQPPRPCYTYWNYQCGSEVTITITDPRVPWCGNPSLPGKTIAIMSIGNDVSMSEIQRQSAGTAEGLTTGGEPFGGSLEPHVFFGADDLLAAGITHYKWSYRKVGTSGWKVMDRKQVIRHYAMPPSSSGGGPTFLPYLLGPDPDPALTGLSLFKIQPRNVPVAGSLGWAPIDAREDSATAFFLSYLEQLDQPNPAEAAQGKYELKFELFKHSAPTVPVDFTAEGITLSEATDPAPFGVGTVHTRLLPTDPAFPALPMPERVFVNSAGHVVGFRLVIHVDNNVCTADIHDVTVGAAAAGLCGFIDFPPGASAHVSFLARHPHGFGQFRFQVFKGSSGRVEVVCAPSPDAGYPSLPSVDSATVNGFTRDAGSNFSKDIPVASLLGSCPKAAFSELLYVYAMAVDGWNRLSYLDGIPSPESKAFALEPAP